MTAIPLSRSTPRPLLTSRRVRFICSTCSVCLCRDGRNSPSISASPADNALVAAELSSPPRNHRRIPIRPPDLCTRPHTSAAARPLALVSHPGGSIDHVRRQQPPDSAQLGLFAQPPRLFSCTPSKLTTFEDCPRRYRYAYVDRPTPPKGPPWAHNSLGASVHTALRSWYGLPAERRRPQALPVLLKATWVSEGYRDETQERAVVRQGLG